MSDRARYRLNRWLIGAAWTTPGISALIYRAIGFNFNRLFLREHEVIGAGLLVAVWWMAAVRWRWRRDVYVGVCVALLPVVVYAPVRELLSFAPFFPAPEVAVLSVVLLANVTAIGILFAWRLGPRLQLVVRGLAGGLLVSLLVSLPTIECTTVQVHRAVLLSADPPLVLSLCAGMLYNQTPLGIRYSCALGFAVGMAACVFLPHKHRLLWALVPLASLMTLTLWPITEGVLRGESDPIREYYYMLERVLMAMPALLHVWLWLLARPSEVPPFAQVESRSGANPRHDI